MEKTMSVNHQEINERIPLAERVRPDKLSGVLGQHELLAEGSLLRRMFETNTFSSVIFWGPPGSGKTTIARLIESVSNEIFVPFSAVFSSIKEVKQVMQSAQDYFRSEGKSTILFIDEIHRFNKSQQDAFLPYVETGAVILIGATTENPSFEVIPALLSRCHILTLKQLSEETLVEILKNALTVFSETKVAEKVIKKIAWLGGGDARRSLNILQSVLEKRQQQEEITEEMLQKLITSKQLFYDKDGEEHYNLISALHKSLRGSDPQAGLFWLARMLESGEDPLYLVRRLVRFASEDIGLADPNALVQAVAVKEAVHFLGMPEANNAMAQLVVYLATAPKSNSLYIAYQKAADDTHKTGNYPVPFHIRNAPTNLMKDLGYGTEYKYPHDFKYHYYYQKYFPDGMKESVYYEPTDFGFEKEISKRLQWWTKLKEQQKNQK